MTFSRISKTILCRAYQKSAFVLKFLLPWNERALLKGTGSFKKLAVYIKKQNISNVLIAVDSTVKEKGLITPFTEKLSELGIKYSIFSLSGKSGAEAAEKCAQAYIDGGCKAIVAVGGGSVIDCAKLAGIKAVNEKKSLVHINGFKPFMRKNPAVFAVPTTTGAGSEATASAVCFDKKAKCGNVVSSPALRPYAAVLDPLMTETLKRGIVARTAMAALSNAVEAYIYTSGTKAARDNAAIAARLVFDNALKAYEKNDIDAEIELQKAAYLAGLSSSRCNTGYAHHIALAVTAAAKVSYSEVAAAALPLVLRAYGEAVYKRLALLADGLKLKGETEAEKAQKLIFEIEKLSEKLSVPSAVKQIKKKDIPKMAKRVSSYCNPSYSAPRMLFFEDICDVLIKLKG